MLLVVSSHRTPASPCFRCLLGVFSGRPLWMVSVLVRMVVDDAVFHSYYEDSSVVHDTLDLLVFTCLEQHQGEKSMCECRGHQT